MNRIEAMKRVGKLVYAITALNGGYIGICKEIITPKGSPWRANVEIKAVTEYPVIGIGQGGGYKRRRPFEEGRIINVGNCSVNLLKDNEAIPNYGDSVKIALDVSIESLEKHIEHDNQIGKKDWLIIKWLGVLKERKLGMESWDILMSTPVLFGLKNQGHIPTIKKMLKDGATWKEIGKVIGWCPETAKEDYGYYAKYTEKGEEK